MWSSAKVVLLLASVVLSAQTASADPRQMSVLDLRDHAWKNGLREGYFGDREIIEDNSMIILEAPGRAEDAAKVPVKIKAQIPQTEQRYIKTITLLIDANPMPFAGRFHFTPKSGRADLIMRVRIDDYTAVRAIAETNDGELHMSWQYVKGAGGCSVPLASDLTEALTRLGTMKFRTRDQAPSEPIAALLNVSHPNITGLQESVYPRRTLPPHFLTELKISFNGEPVMTAETGISMSADPSFGFYFVPDRDGELRADITDSQNLTFTKVHTLKVEP